MWKARSSRTAANGREKEAANFVVHFRKKDREVDESLAKVRQLEKHREAKVKFVQEEEARIRREAILPRKITFATPTAAAHNSKGQHEEGCGALKKKDEEIDINYVRKLVASAMQQPSKADTSRRLESNPDHCISTAQKDALASQHCDGESRTGSTERRRKVREHPNPIPVPSDSTLKNPAKGKDPMYTGRNKYRVPSPPPWTSRPPLPPRRRSLAGNTRPHGPGGINIHDNMPPPRNRSRERTPEPRRSRNQDREPSLAKPRPRGRIRIEDYYNAVTFAGGTPNIACRMLLYLIGPARVWLGDLEENTIFCWFDLLKAFENHFRGTYKRPATTSDLQACIQKKGETSRSFLTRWLATRNECENVDNRTAMHVFIGGLQRGGLLRHKLTCR
ncbi:hypothetical protein QYE76_065173 [Lolium multiflorum]|uniref:Retrotransposon gag domain-containing protein n=1 Tax=Lolium multiflorum TaxID=4521 RepID=A0AAD8S9R7_LOLMU|nr:hypothetical protein QYE76_065173 [Lolium multiflorum]